MNSLISCQRSPMLLLPQLIAMNLSVKVLVALLAVVLCARSSRSFSLRPQAVRERKSRRVDNTALVIPFNLIDDTHRHPSSYHYYRCGVASARDAHVSSFPSKRTFIPTSSVSVCCRPRRQRSRPLHVAGIPLAPGDTRDLIQTTAGDGENRKSREEEGVDEGAAIYLRLESVVSREIEVAGQRVLMRLATHDDFLAIADVRFDVFSPVHKALKHRFQERSCMLMRERRLRGAFCLVAALKRDATGFSEIKSNEDRTGEREGGEAVTDDASPARYVVGTLECSRHEFDGTPLAVETEEGADRIARLYLTEVAVRSDCRRLGLGRQLLGLVDDVAKELKTSEVFLHVNEVNTAALGLYAACGYEEAPDSPPNRAFTNSLGLAGGFIGQRHRLLLKTFPAGSGGAGQQ